jgi:hypothetical protein
MNEPEEITGMKGNTIPRKLSVDYISFSAHVDYSQNSEFIDLIKAPQIVRFSTFFLESLRPLYGYPRSSCMGNKRLWVALGLRYKRNIKTGTRM